jgi:hypothetical protein
MKYDIKPDVSEMGCEDVKWVDQTQKERNGGSLLQNVKHCDQAGSLQLHESIPEMLLTYHHTTRRLNPEDLDLSPKQMASIISSFILKTSHFKQGK